MPISPLEQGLQFSAVIAVDNGLNEVILGVLIQPLFGHFVLLEQGHKDRAEGAKRDEVRVVLNDLQRPEGLIQEQGGGDIAVHEGACEIGGGDEEGVKVEQDGEVVLLDNEATDVAPVGAVMQGMVGLEDGEVWVGQGELAARGGGVIPVGCAKQEVQGELVDEGLLKGVGYLLGEAEQPPASSSGEANGEHGDGHADAGGIGGPNGAADGLGGLGARDHSELGEGELPDAEGLGGDLGVPAELICIDDRVSAGGIDAEGGLHNGVGEAGASAREARGLDHAEDVGVGALGARGGAVGDGAIEGEQGALAGSAALLILGAEGVNDLGHGALADAGERVAGIAGGPLEVWLGALIAGDMEGAGIIGAAGAPGVAGEQVALSEGGLGVGPAHGGEDGGLFDVLVRRVGAECAGEARENGVADVVLVADIIHEAGVVGGQEASDIIYGTKHL